MATSFLVPLNNAVGHLGADLSVAGLSITLESGEGASFPTTYPFHVTVGSSEDSEIVEVSDNTDDVLTITRSAESTTAATATTGTEVSLNITAQAVSDLNTAVNALEAYDVMTTRGDMIYEGASAPARLAKGADNTILAMGANDPEWKTPAVVLADMSGVAASAFDWNSQNLTGLGTLNTHTLPGGTDIIALLAATQEFTNKTLNASVAKGTWTASGTWTIPAVTLGGAVSGNAQTISNANVTVGASRTLDVSAGTLTLANDQISGDKVEGGTINTIIINSLTLGSVDAFAMADNANIYNLNASENVTIGLRGGPNAVGSGASIQLYGHAHGTPGALKLQTSNVAGDSDVVRLTLSGAVATAIATWANITHTGLVLSGNMDAGGYVLNAVGEVYGKATYGALYLNGSPFGSSGTPIVIRTTGATPTFSALNRITIAANADEATITFANSNLVGMKLGGNMTVTGYAFDAGAGNAVVTTTGNLKGLSVRSSNVTSGGGCKLQIFGNDTSPAIDDIPAALTFAGMNSTPAEFNYGAIQLRAKVVTAGSEDSRFEFDLNTAGASNKAMELTGAGVLSVDLGGSGSAAQVDLFDDYDDAIVLKRGIQENNRELLADMGILERKGTGSGYMMKLQPMVRLLAGGIYQTRQMLEDTRDELMARLENVERKLLQAG